MNPDRIKISEEFHIGKGLWLSVECPIVLGEDPVEEFKKARTVLHQAFNSINQSSFASATDYNTGQKEVEDAEINARFEETKRMIQEAKTHIEAEEILAKSEFKLNLELKRIALHK
jgi:hypothetical protein